MKSTAILCTLFAVSLAAPAPRNAYNKRQGQNFQTFTGALGGITATPVTDSGNADRKFQVKGDTFVNIGAALQRSCDQQFNACANKANGGDQTLSVSACTDQKTQCDAAGQGNTGASNNVAAASSTDAAAAVPCDQGSISNAGATASATATAVVAAVSSTTAAAANPCDTAAAAAAAAAALSNISASPTATAAVAATTSTAVAASIPCNTAAAAVASDAGMAKATEKIGKGNMAAQAATDPCDKKKRSTGNRSLIARRITRRFKVA